MVESQTSSVMSSSRVPVWLMPAELTTPSIRPKAASIAATAARTSASRVTSAVAKENCLVALPGALCELAPGLRVEADAEDPRAGCAEELGRRPADAGRRAGDEDCLAAQRRTRIAHAAASPASVAAFAACAAAIDAKHALLAGFGLDEFVDEAAVGEDQTAVAEADHFLQLGGDDDQADALAGELDDEPVDLVAGADVDALGRLVEEEDVRRVHQHAGEEELLLVAAGKVRHGRRRGARLDVQFAHGADGGVVLPLRLTMPRRAKRSRLPMVMLPRSGRLKSRPERLRSSVRSAMPALPRHRGSS